MVLFFQRLLRESHTSSIIPKSGLKFKTLRATFATHTKCQSHKSHTFDATFDPHSCRMKLI